MLTLALVAVAAPVAHAQRPPASPDLVVTVRVEAIESVPACGVLFASPVVRHTVLSVERGRYAPSSLYAYYACGWTSSGARLVPGAVLRLSLTRRARHPFGSTIDTMGDPALPRFYVESAVAP